MEPTTVLQARPSVGIGAMFEALALSVPQIVFYRAAFFQLLADGYTVDKALGKVLKSLEVSPERHPYFKEMFAHASLLHAGVGVTMPWPSEAVFFASRN